MDKISIVELKKTMEDSYIDYAMSVIAQRALPDVRDGLKPVQRRILYAMIELNNGPDKPHRKCARIVGDTMGKYHPHGDSSIYDALVKLAQDFSTRYPLVDGHGNFGSVDGDAAAAMRYTEARLDKISMELLSDINKETVDFVPNFDETEREPTVLPARFPNLLVNGTTGIAVGMATNIPPHNLGEVIDAVVKIIDNKVEEDRDTTMEELLGIVRGPDFPTGAMTVGYEGIKQAYTTGRGKVKVRAVADIEVLANGKPRIIVTELPYMVNKARLLEKIADLVKDKRIDGITDLRDESNREGTRIIIELRRDVNAKVMLNQLYKHTQMQETFGVIMLALVNNEPKVLTLSDMLLLYLNHQVDVVTRRCEFELRKARERAHILEGLEIALDNIDEVIKIIRGSKTVAEAKERLQERFSLSERQSHAIVEMKIRTLTAMEKDKILNELAALRQRIAELVEILGDKKLVLGIIKDEIMVIRNKYADERRTRIEYSDDEINMEDLIPNEYVVIARSNLGYIKRMTVGNFKNQHRGGKGIRGMSTIDDDYIVDLMLTKTHSYMLFFTNKGRVYRLKAYDIPEASRTARGVAIVNLLELEAEEKIETIIPMKEIDEEQYLVMVTRQGLVKKTSMKEYVNIHRKGKIAIRFRDNDELIDVKLTDDENDIFLVTKNGQCIRFHEQDVRETGRNSMGVKGISLRNGDTVVSVVSNREEGDILFVSERGLGKRTAKQEFKVQNRGGYGTICYKCNERSGPVVGAMNVKTTDEIMMITNEGIAIRMDVSSVSVLGRYATGVKMMNVVDDVKIAGLSPIKENQMIQDTDIEAEQADETTAEADA
ncbi:MAG: DNA gyrase subunit A [Eubacteriales bacterium]|nr:DNA gyrase subunit A [Eubacteriales bacterium]